MVEEKNSVSKSLPPETRLEKNSMKEFIQSEMKCVNKESEEKFYKTNFDLLNIVNWLIKDPKAYVNYKEGNMKKLLKHLKSVRKVLRKPIPSQKEVKSHLKLPKIEELYRELKEKLGELPRDTEVSREVFIKIADAEKEYKAYRKKAGELLEDLNKTIRSVENSINELEYF
ncbi:hypothetical protein AKJ51_05085 [candidate division MSBL1 archaeon SCGC-AAA382A20]|uniref:Uncharacterized protein n=1 Tax=candidate division MSBL1 archaeon SCGC-AAA382A20 TaxID=1698280 RepID=A0A133VG17_9EURY|nr:hypothetical protein AKJ51_05085 [candidate division MSBL1 archaeon SCGC-AAA382A20]